MPALRWLVEQGALVGSAGGPARAQAGVVRSEGVGVGEVKLMLQQWLRWCMVAA